MRRAFLAAVVVLVALAGVSSNCPAQQPPASGADGENAAPAEQPPEGKDAPAADGQAADAPEKKEDKADEKMKPPKYRLVMEGFMQLALAGAEMTGATKNNDQQRRDGLKALQRALDALQEELPEAEEGVAQLRAAHRPWGEVYSGPDRDRKINLLDLEAKEAAAELALLADSMRTSVRQMIRSAKIAADDKLEPEPRLVAALDVQHWRQNLTRVYGNFWVHHWPGLFIYLTSYEKVVEEQVYQGGLRNLCTLKQDVFETVGNGISAMLVPPTELQEKDEADIPLKAVAEEIPPSIDVYRQDPKSWPKIRRVVPKGSVLDIQVYIWQHGVTNAHLEAYAFIVKDESKPQRYLDIGALCDWEDYPYTRKPKPQFLSADEGELPEANDTTPAAPERESQEEGKKKTGRSSRGIGRAVLASPPA
jgi:hypothetical protein